MRRPLIGRRNRIVERGRSGGREVVQTLIVVSIAGAQRIEHPRLWSRLFQVFAANHPIANIQCSGVA